MLVCTQVLVGAVRPSSTKPSQSSSFPLQTSAVGGLTSQVCSQPLSGSLSRFAKPGLQNKMPQVEPVQLATALVRVQAAPHAPQLFGSLLGLKTSSMRPLQSSSMP